MTLYEFLTTAFSILIAVTIVRLLDGFISIIRSRNAFSIHLIWIVAGMLGALAAGGLFGRFQLFTGHSDCSY
ncbi:MAG: hypothetical protein QF535_23115 [Anaerolineales bacterium]|nr:hypothetical protein [Anaerolineales bacterium]